MKKILLLLLVIITINCYADFEPADLIIKNGILYATQNNKPYTGIAREYVYESTEDIYTYINGSLKYHVSYYYDPDMIPDEIVDIYANGKQIYSKFYGKSGIETIDILGKNGMYLSKIKYEDGTLICIKDADENNYSKYQIFFKGGAVENGVIIFNKDFYLNKYYYLDKETSHLSYENFYSLGKIINASINFKDGTIAPAKMAKEYSELGLKAYKSKDYVKAINNFYLAVKESEKDEKVTNGEKAGVYSDYALALIRGGLVEQGIFIALYSMNLTKDDNLKASNFYNISIALDEIIQNKWKTYKSYPEELEKYSKITKEMASYLRGKGEKLEISNSKNLIGKLIDESIKNNGINTIDSIELNDKFVVHLKNGGKYTLENTLSKEYSLKDSFKYGNIYPSYKKNNFIIDSEFYLRNWKTGLITKFSEFKDPLGIKTIMLTEGNKMTIIRVELSYDDETEIEKYKEIERSEIELDK